MKRILCLILTLILILSCLPAAAATEEYTYVQIPCVVEKDGQTFTYSLPAIAKDHELYVAPDQLPQLTRYPLSGDDARITYKLGRKFLSVDLAEQTLRVNGLSVSFSGTLLAYNIHHLPLSQLLPHMNVQYALTDDGSLHLVSDGLSFWEVTEDFNSEDYVFDLAAAYGESVSGTVGLIAMNVFDCILDIPNLWKRVVPVQDSETSQYEYDIYLECFREFALPETGAKADVAKGVSELSKTVANGYDLADAWMEGIFTEETQQKLTDLFGEDAAKGFGKIDTETQQNMQLLGYANNALTYLKSGILYARIISADTTDYAQALRYMYEENNPEASDGVKLAAINAAIALESEAGALVHAAQEFLRSTATNFVDELIENASEEAIETLAADTVFSSLGVYLDVIDHTLSLIWPVNKAFEEITKMTVYQSIQYDAWTAYANTSTTYTEVSETDLQNARTCALLFLKAAKKCHNAQQDAFDLFGNKDVMDVQIGLIDERIQLLRLTEPVEARDAIYDRTEDIRTLQELFAIMLPGSAPTEPPTEAPTEAPTETPVEPPVEAPTEAPAASANPLVGNWFFYERPQGEDYYLVSYLYFYADGTAAMGYGPYATDMGKGFFGTWSINQAIGNRLTVHLEGNGGEFVLGSTAEQPFYSFDVTIEYYEDGTLMIQNINAPELFWLDCNLHERDLYLQLY